MSLSKKHATNPQLSAVLTLAVANTQGIIVSGSSIMPDESLLKEVREHATRVRAEREDARVAGEQMKRDYEDFIADFETLKSEVIFPALSGVAKEYSDNATLEKTAADSGAIKLTLPSGRWIEFGVDTMSRRVVVRWQLKTSPMALREILHSAEAVRLPLEETTSHRVDQLINEFLRDYLSAVRQDETAT